MEQQTSERNPFMLMLNPEAIFAAVEKSERLGKLNRHLCRPLDRPAAASTTKRAGAIVVDDEIDDDAADESVGEA